MKYIFLLIPFIFVSCSNIEISGNNTEEKTLSGTYKNQEPQKYRWEARGYKDFPYKVYNSGNILSVDALMELYVYPKKVLNLETMKEEEDIRYINSNACTFAICNRYRISVKYPNGEIRTEYVVDQEYTDRKSELIDDSDFYKNK